MQEVLEQTNISTFQELLHFAADAHQSPGSRHAFGGQHRIIPTALTFAGGVNSADHAQTFPALVSLFRQQVISMLDCAHSQSRCRSQSRNCVLNFIWPILAAQLCILRVQSFAWHLLAISLAVSPLM